MVLKLGTLIVMSTLVLTHTTHAQGRARGGAGVGADRGAGIDSGGRGFAPGYSRRPVLFGFALECVDCQPTGPTPIGRGGFGNLRRPDGSLGSYTLVYNYTSFPRVAAVLPNSVAEAAGIRVGDLLRAIDGYSLLTEEGSRHFASASAGDEVRLTFDRDSKTIEVPLVLGRAGGRGRGGPVQTFDAMSARYVGAYGNVDLDVWSDEPVSVSRDSTGAMILRTGTTVVRLRADLIDSARAGRGRGGAVGRGAGRGGRGATPPYQQ
jgi:hypothetical protein